MKYLKKYNEKIDWEFDDEDELPIHPDFQGHEEFHDFLKKNNALDKFIENYNNNNNNNRNRNRNVSLLNFLNKINWNDIYHDWINIYYNKKKQNKNLTYDDNIYY